MSILRLRAGNVMMLVAAADWHAWAVLALLLMVVVLFALETLRVDLVALVGLCGLIGLGILAPEEAFAGFGTPTLVMLASVFVIGGALQETGVLEWVAGRMIRFLPKREVWQVLGIMLVAAVLSAFMNNTTVTAMLVPLTVGMARRTGVAPSRLLMPLAFASILGGTCTLIGTSTNVAVSGFVAAKAGLAPFGLFEITPLGGVFVAVGIAFMVLVGRHLLPRHPEADLADDFGIRGFLSEIVIQPGSPLAGRPVSDSELAHMEFRVLKVIRSNIGFDPDSDTVLEVGDVLVVTGNVANLMKVKTTSGIEIRPELKLGDADLRRAGLELAEVVISPRSTLIGRTLSEARFHREFGLTVLAIYRAGQSLRDRISRIRFKVGDLLLVQGPLEALNAVRSRRDLAVLSERGPADPAWRKPMLAMGVFGAALVLGGLEVVSTATAFLMAAVTMVLSGCLRPVRLYDHVEWRLLVLIGSMLAFGRAMDHTGAADMLSGWVIALVGGHGPEAVIGGFCLLTVLLTQPMSNAAAALVVLPVALKAAAQIGVDPRAVSVAIMISASMSLATPLEPSSVLVFGPGKYRFSDFLKVGLPLTLILLGLMLWLLPHWWPL